MTGGRRLVLDANILLRAVIGERVPELLERYNYSVSFCSPDICFEETRRHLPTIAAKRGINIEISLFLLDQLEHVVERLDDSLYQHFELRARQRIPRDKDDWPIIAAALQHKCSIWTEDRDFFGCGIATWTTRTVELYLAPDQGPH